MSLDRSLKVSGGMVRSRSVLTRAERIAKLVEEEKFDKDRNSPFGLPKVRVHHSRAGAKAKKEKVAEGAEGAAATAAAPGAAPAADAKGKPGAAPGKAAAKAPEAKGKAGGKKK